MKYIIRISTLITLLAVLPLSAQKLETAPSDQSVVYFVRAKSMGSLVNFTFFDGKKAIGKFSGRKFFRYQCEPGKHLFWARSENRSFVEAELVAGKSYMIEAVPKMGGLKAAVKLVPVEADVHDLKKIKKVFSKKAVVTFSLKELNELQEEMEGVIVRGLERYDQGAEQNEEIAKLPSNMTIDVEELLAGLE